MSRRKAREYALKTLYLIESASNDTEKALHDVEQLEGSTDVADNFVSELVFGTIEKLPAIDEVISRYAIGWTLSRMAAVDRAILRMAIFEMMFVDDIPVSVSINEAVDLANKYSTNDSGKFINGILGKVVRDNSIQKNNCLT